MYIIVRIMGPNVSVTISESIDRTKLVIAISVEKSRMLIGYCAMFLFHSSLYMSPGLGSSSNPIPAF